MHTTLPLDTHKRILLACMCVALLVASVAAIASSVAIILKALASRNQFQDDAYYYIVIARNLVDHGIASFDGIHVTNGYHPLWMGILWALFAATGTGAPLAQQIVAVTLVEQFLFLASVGICAAAALRHATRQPIASAGFAIVAVWMVGPAHSIFAQGMETTLAAALLIGIFYCITQRHLLAASWLVGLLTLARLDTAVFIAIPLLVWICMQQRKASRAIFHALPVAVMLGGYLVVNIATTGHAMPISGALKSTFPAVHWQVGFLREPWILARRFGWLSLVSTANILFTIGVLVVAAGFLFRRHGRDDAMQPARIGWLIAFLLVLNLLVFQRWAKSIDPRYFALPTIAALFAAGCALAETGLARFHGRWHSLQKSTAGCLLAVALLIAPVHGLSLAIRQLNLPPGPNIVAMRMKAIKAALPDGAVIAGTDVGELAFWTGHRVIDLDGLVNNWEYQRILHDKKLERYLAEQGVTYIATAVVDRVPRYTARPIEPMYRQAVDAAAVAGGKYPPHEFYVFSYLYGTYSDSVPLWPEDEVYRENLGSNGYIQIVYLVYRLHLNG